MVHYRNFLTHELQIVNTGRRYLQKTSFSATALTLVILTAFFSLSLGASSLINSVTIQSTGQISIANIVAKSGYWRDIQEAVNWVVAHGGIGNVYIPEGTWNFINPGESWTEARVVIPAGVNVFGAPTERDENDQVVEWRTVLVMPSSVWSDNEDNIPAWFSIEGSNDATKPSRFSDIKLVGYRSFDHNNPYMHRALEVGDVVNFRIDHCYFEHTTAGISIDGSCGVIDHCYLVNEYGVPDPYTEKTIGYGVHVADWNYQGWDDIRAVLGKYTPRTVFIEDCYFSKWRHCVCVNNAGHVVFRHNIVSEDFAYASLDQHEKRVYSAGRAYEIYNNQFINPDPFYLGVVLVMHWRGGGGAAFNNTVTGYKDFAWLTENAGYQEEQYQPHDIYIWNNDIPTDCTLVTVYGDIRQNRDYFLYAPSWYTPYPYPHPLTLG